MRKQLDKNLSFHKLVAYMIALMTGEPTILDKTLTESSLYKCFAVMFITTFWHISDSDHKKNKTVRSFLLIDNAMIR